MKDDRLISLNAAIDALNKKWRTCIIGESLIRDAGDTLKALPSAQQWIPTSVKPPEPFKLVLIQDSCGCYELNTYIPPRINPKQYPNGYWGEVGTVDFDYFDVEAWCPLPAPWEGGQDGKN